MILYKICDLVKERCFRRVLLEVYAMPLQMVFQNHSDLGSFGLPSRCLYHNQMVPTDLMFMHLERRGRDYFKEYAHASEEVRARWDRQLGGARPLIHWMCSVVSEIEDVLGEAFSWTFERHYFSRWCDEESENAIEIGLVFWHITIRDLEDVVVHRHWSIAVSEEWGDLRVMRGTPGSAHSFDGCDWKEGRKVYLPRLLDAIREHQRIRNFRLERIRKAR